jgi:diaminopimelate decarboxylase
MSVFSLCLERDHWKNQLKLYRFEIQDEARKISSIQSKNSIQEGNPSLEGISLQEIADEYGRSVLLIQERVAQESFEFYSSRMKKFSQILKPKLRLNKSTARSQGERTSVPLIFSAFECMPRMGQLRRAEEWGLGVICHSVKEIEKSIRAGMQPESLIAAFPLSGSDELKYLAKYRGLALEIGSLEELHLLTVWGIRSETSLENFRILLRLSFSNSGEQFSFLNEDELRVAFERLRHGQHSPRIGISVLWNSHSELDLGKIKHALHIVRSIAEEALSAGVAMENVVIGNRSTSEFGAFLWPDSKDSQWESVLNTCEVEFAGAPYGVSLAVGDAIWDNASHGLYKASCAQLNEVRSFYFSDPLLFKSVHQDAAFDILPLAFPQKEQILNERVEFWGMRCEQVRERVLLASKNCASGASLGEWFLFPRLGLPYVKSQSNANRWFVGAPEILVTLEGDLEILRVAERTEDFMRGET